MIRAGIIGFAHMHVNEVALYLNNQPLFELVGAADSLADVTESTQARYTRLWNMRNIKDNYCHNIYSDYKRLLDIEKPDIVFILSENSEKLSIVRECAARKINICIEKPIAMNFEEAIAISKAVSASGIEAVVNWPVLWRPYIHRIKQALDLEILGKANKLRYINGHTGPLGKGAKHRGVQENADEMTDAERSTQWWYKQKSGGGVFLDICCYGCMFSDWFLGSKFKSIYASGANLNTPYGDVADNMAAIIQYDGKMSVIEGTWTTPRAVIPSGPMVICEGGVIMATGGAENSPDVKAFDIYGNEVKLPQFTAEEKYLNMPCHYANHIETGEAVHKMATLEENLNIMKLLDGAIKSFETGEKILLQK